MIKKNIVIIFLGDFFFDARCINMARSLLKANHSVTIICTYNKIIDDEKFNDIQFHNIRLQRKGPLRYLEFHGKVVKLLKNKTFDAVIAGDLYALSSARLFKNTHIIYDCREIYTELSAHISKPLYKKVSCWYEKYFLKYVNTILTTADSDEKLLKKKYGCFKHLKWYIVYNYPINYKNYKKHNLKIKFNIPTNHTTIIYQGVIQKHRGVGQLIELIKSSDNITAIIIGGGESKDHYIQKTKQLNIINKVIFINKVPYLELLDYTADCDIGWLVIKGQGISNKLAMPNKLFEYTLMGLPVISSQLKNMERIIKKYNLGVIVEENNVDQQINAVQHIMNNQAQYVHIKKTIVEKFIWDLQHDKFIKLINEK